MSSVYPPFIFQAAIDGFFNPIIGAIDSVHLVKDYKPSDSDAELAAKSIANIAIDLADMGIQTIDGEPTLVINPKSNLAKTASSERYEATQATGGTVNSIIKAGAGWVVNEHVGRVVHITGGTGASESGKIVSNTSDTLVLHTEVTGYNENGAIVSDALAVAPDATSDFEILDDVWAVFFGAGQKVHAVDESTDKAIDGANADQVSTSAAAIALPPMFAKAS